jgi:prevent-host-death family protein
MCYLVGMERIGVRELRQHATRYLARVKAGETVEVTERGQLVALLVPPAPGATERERLIATGQLVPASRPFRVPRRAPLPAAGPDTGAALDDLRAERA